MDQKLSYRKRELAINTVRVLAIDFVQKANYGHPGTAISLALVGHVLRTKFLQYNLHNSEHGRSPGIIRPEDANETVQTWRVTPEHRGGSTLLGLTRQELPMLPRDASNGADRSDRGAYMLTNGGALPGINGFGESAPAEVLYAHFGFTVENIVAKAKSLLQ